MSQPIDKSRVKVLIANRGEVALRIIRTCRAMGLPSIVVFSEADRKSLPVLIADEAICIGAAAASDSYLKIDRVITAAALTGATAIHPGYGFLAENPHFASVCNDCGITFIGPSADAISSLGDKAKARQLMQNAGVPVVPGSDGPVANVSDALEWAEKLGYPVILKASAGGGGKGMRVAQNADQLPAAFNTASTEAKNGFGNGELYMERYLVDPRHVEVQFMADSYGHVVTLGERDCSLQRRHQKMIEETPCPVLPEGVRRQMCQAVVKAAQSVRYTGAGTVEFLYEPSTESFYFMEINTRLQVEHGISEMTHGVDIVAAQIQVALGEKLPWEQKEVKANGCSIEIRINAEDPQRSFAPAPGMVTFCQMPGGPGVRVDSHLYDGYVIPPYYDSLVAKIMVHGATREIARRRALTALKELSVEGVKTTRDFAASLLQSQEFVTGEYHTGTLDELLKRQDSPLKL